MEGDSSFDHMQAHPIIIASPDRRTKAFCMFSIPKSHNFEDGLILVYITKPNIGGEGGDTVENSLL